jgi:hypothetical protein
VSSLRENAATATPAGEHHAGPSLTDAGSAPSEQTRISIRLSPQARQAVEEIMRLSNFETIQDAVRRAIGDELFLLKERKEGRKVLLQKDNQYREIYWPDL